MRMASHMDDAWKPMCFMPWKRSSAVMGRPRNWLKSSSSTFCASSGISTDLTSTASLAALGGRLDDAMSSVVGCRNWCTAFLFFLFSVFCFYFFCLFFSVSSGRTVTREPDYRSNGVLLLYCTSSTKKSSCKYLLRRLPTPHFWVRCLSGREGPGDKRGRS